MSRYDDDDDDPAILKDGQILRVPLYVMDGLQTSIAGDALASHRPGPRYAADAERGEGEDAYQKCKLALGDAWKEKHPQNTWPPEMQRNHAQKHDGAIQDAKTAYADYCAHLANAWRMR